MTRMINNKKPVMGQVDLLIEGPIRIRRIRDPHIKTNSKYLVTVFDRLSDKAFEEQFSLFNEGNVEADVKLIIVREAFAQLGEKLFKEVVKGFK